MASNPCKNDSDTVLLVEGKNDCHVVMALCSRHNVPQTFGIYECDGYEKALQRLNALIIRPNPPKIIGLVVDVDDADLNDRWTGIQHKLNNYDYTFPPKPDQNGTIIESASEVTRIGFWLMPNNQDPGMLEDFCLEMIGESRLTTIRNCVELARSEGCTTFKSAHHSKAVIHTYLALQDEPGRPLGQAITAQTLSSETQSASYFVDWLKRLFCEPANA